MMLEKIHPYYYLGGIIGGISGYVIAKIYQIWAIVYRESQLDLHMLHSWNSQSPPLWITATENPQAFSFWVVLVFIVVGISFVKILLHATKLKD